jgi:hypothetical protein
LVALHEVSGCFVEAKHSTAPGKTGELSIAKLLNKNGILASANFNLRPVASRLLTNRSRQLTRGECLQSMSEPLPILFALAAR